MLNPFISATCISTKKDLPLSSVAFTSRMVDFPSLNLGSWKVFGKYKSVILCSPSRHSTAFKKEMSTTCLFSSPKIFLKAISSVTLANFMVLFFSKIYIKSHHYHGINQNQERGDFISKLNFCFLSEILG